MNRLAIIEHYPNEKYNLLGNTDVMVDIPDIKSPVVQAVRLDTDTSKGDVYIQQKAMDAWRDKRGTEHPATPARYAITKNGLKKLADGAGIQMVSSEHVIPTTCQKCVAVNQHSGKVVQCGDCNNRDVSYRVTISVPQLTGEVLMVADTHEIIVDNVTPDMSDKQRKEFMKHLPQICEAKALNGAIRTALHIKGTYTLEELRKPFVVAYLVPNLDHDQVKRAAIEGMFQSVGRLFGAMPDAQQIETRVPGETVDGAADEGCYDQYVDGTYTDTPGPQDPGAQGTDVREQDLYCDKCGVHITEKVWDYSVGRYDRPLCYKCQQIERGTTRR